MYPGLNPLAVDDMTFDQIGSLLSRGQSSQELTAQSPGEIAEIARDYRENWRRYHGLD